MTSLIPVSAIEPVVKIITDLDASEDEVAMKEVPRPRPRKPIRKEELKTFEANFPCNRSRSAEIRKNDKSVKFFRLQVYFIVIYETVPGQAQGRPN